MATLAPAYAPRRPTETALHGIVRDNLETFLSWARETYAKPLPRYVEQELRAHLRCGVFAHGFVHCRCDDCGHDILVAFSCKQRGACPSCAGRRMANTAAHLVDRVLPDVPVRQYVLSLPFELRALAAFKPEVLRAMARLFVESTFGLYRARARRDGLMGGESCRCGQKAGRLAQIGRRGWVAVSGTREGRRGARRPPQKARGRGGDCLTRPRAGETALRPSMEA